MNDAPISYHGLGTLIGSALVVAGFIIYVAVAAIQIAWKRWVRK